MEFYCRNGLYRPLGTFSRVLPDNKCWAIFLWREMQKGLRTTFGRHEKCEKLPWLSFLGTFLKGNCLEIPKMLSKLICVYIDQKLWSKIRIFGLSPNWSHLYVRPFVRPSVRPSVTPFHGNRSWLFSETLQLVRACRCEKNVPSAFLKISTVLAILAKNCPKCPKWPFLA